MARNSLPLVLLLFVTAAGAEPPTKTVAMEALTSGLWHAHVQEEDFLYEFTIEDGHLGGRMHRVVGDKQMLEVPLSWVKLDGSAIEIGMGMFPPYVGEVDLEAARIVGGLPEVPPFRELNLTRVDAAEWPMTRPRPPAEAGKSSSLWTRPQDIDDGWPTGAPSDFSIDPANVDRTIQVILDGEAGSIHSLLVVRDGTLLVEEYFHGWAREDLHMTASCTKSVASLLTGIAIDQGHIEGVDVPLLQFFPELSASAGQGWEAVQLQHLLTMSMGLDWTDEEAEGWPPLENQYALVLERKVTTPPGTQWRYGNRDVNLLTGVISQSTGVEADAFAAKHLFEPLGIDDWDWDYRRWEVHPDMATGLSLRPRDMAKLGQLLVNQGTWQDRRVVSEEWIRELPQTHIPTDRGKGYSYLWWRFDPPPPDFPLGIVTLAWGVGSQYIWVVPEARLVVVITGGNNYNERAMDILQVLNRYLVPGVVVS
ncbi:MAG: serine hydrolase [Thermoanaerobaculia bacterium]